METLMGPFSYHELGAIMISAFFVFWLYKGTFHKNPLEWKVFWIVAGGIVVINLTAILTGDKLLDNALLVTIYWLVFHALLVIQWAYILGFLDWPFFKNNEDVLKHLVVERNKVILSAAITGVWLGYFFLRNINM